VHRTITQVFAWVLFLPVRTCYDKFMKKSFSVRAHGLIILGMLIVQYVFGMLSNLFVAFPEGATAWEQWKFAHGQFVMMAHIDIGVLLLGMAVALYVRAVRRHHRIWKIAAGGGMGAILLAVVSGSEFINTQSDVYSVTMSLLFIIAVAAYGWGIYATKGE
jgi:hypothetical protein